MVNDSNHQIIIDDRLLSFLFIRLKLIRIISVHI